MTKLKTNQKRKIRRRKANTTAMQASCTGLVYKGPNRFVTKRMLQAFMDRRFTCSVPPQSGKNCYDRWTPVEWCRWILRTGKFHLYEY